MHTVPVLSLIVRSSVLMLFYNCIHIAYIIVNRPRRWTTLKVGSLLTEIIHNICQVTDYLFAFVALHSE